ncbi:MAG: glycosyltransferase [Actinobacteria bacterium]|nr:glycosyltransferase [Actinomycetota bacterium]
MTEAGAEFDPLQRILMLVPHDPDLDPRVGSSIELCRSIARTEVIASTWATQRPAKEYDGVVSVERVDASTNASDRARRAAALGNRLDLRLSTQEYKQHEGRPPDGMKARVRHHLGGVFRFAAAWSAYSMLISTLLRRASVVGVRPRVIIAHDIYALIPAAILKQRWGCALLYDAHEYFPASDLLAPPWQMRVIRRLERHFIRKADRVVTVSPPLAAQLQRDYGVQNVIVVPNTEPVARVLSEIRPHDPADQVRFLLQGQAAPGRGFERLLDLWRELDDPRAVLQIRAPDWEYPRVLRERYQDLADRGRCEWLDPVVEDRLVEAAAAAEIGVIPYVGPNMNHLFACPNKLAQYMCAGLAVFSNNLPYVGSVIARFDCGLTYDADDSKTFLRAARRLIDEPDLRRRLRENALAAAGVEYNWEQTSEPYRAAISELFG